MCVCVCRYSYLVLQPTTTTTTTAGGEQATPPPPPGEGVSGGSGSRSKSSKRRKSTGKRRSRRFGRRSSMALINFSDGSPATTAKVRHTHAHMMYNTYTSHFAHIHTLHTFTFTLHHRYYTVCLHNLCHDTHFTHTNMHTHTHTVSLPPSLSLPQVNPPCSPTTNHSVFSPAQPNTSSNTAPNSGQVPTGNLLSFTTQQGEPIIYSFSDNF